MKKAIITGANGFVGSHLVQSLAGRGTQVFAVVRNRRSDISSIQNMRNVTIVYCDLSEIQTLPEKLSANDFDAFFHLAWSSGKKLRQTGLSDQLDYLPYSVSCMDTAKSLGCKRFVGTGSVLEYVADLPLPNHPNMLYAVSKDFANKLLLLHAREIGISYSWCRLSGIYGSGDGTGNLVSYTVNTLLGGSSPTYSQALQPYSFVHVTDCANAIAAVGNYSGEDTPLVFIGGNEIWAVRQFMETIGRIINPEIELKFGIRPDDGVRYKKEWFDISTLKNKIGYTPAISFEDGIRQILKSRR
jgi:UDP-glucose 4-epimerase